MNNYRDDHIHVKEGVFDYNILKKFVEQAIKMNLNSITLLDHGYRISPKHNAVIDSISTAETFINNIKKIRLEYPNIIINSGIELDYSFDKNFRTITRNLINNVQFDKVFGSIHSMNNLNSIEYFQAVLAMLDEYDIDVLAHIDLRLEYKKNIKMLNKVIKKCAIKNVAIEFNTSNRTRLNKEKFELIVVLLKKYKCNYTVGSDAHEIKDVGYYVKEMTNIINDKL